MSVKIEILDYIYTDNTKTVVDSNKSVIGELDVTDHSDFPLALTFQISDIKDLTSTSGDYSKTFKIPATKNNNQLLKHSYTANIDTDINITENKKCRILVDNLFSIKGLIKVTGVGGYGENPSYYDCVFFGNNLSWADDLSNSYISDIEWGAASKNLKYNKTSIVATWQDSDCDSSTSVIVYPITSYGGYNPDGLEVGGYTNKTIQLLDTYGDFYGYGASFSGYYGFNNANQSYGTPVPTADWRPAVFVKDTLEKIFAGAGSGYKINSNFMNTDMFKRLVWLLPNFKYNNPEERYKEFAVETSFENGVSMTASGGSFSPITENGIQLFSDANIEQDDGDVYFTGSSREELEIVSPTNLSINLDNGSYVDSTNHYITIGEYGYYDININGIESKIARVYKDGGDDVKINDVHTAINLEVQTVGQTSWNIISQSSHIFSINQNVDFNTDASTDYAEMPSINRNNVWLNKGDRIRLTLGTKLTCTQRPYQEFILSIFFKTGSFSEFNIVFKSQNVEYGQTYDLENVINKDYKQIDFVKGIAHAFNLKMTTNETTRVVNIEPFNSFYKDYAEAIDWTYKLDRSKQIEDKWLKSDLKRDFVFKYKSDSNDKKVERRGEQYFHNIKDEYPYQETLPKTFEKGESKYENPFFAGSYNAKDLEPQAGASDPPYSACLWQENAYGWESYRPEKGYNFSPRLLYWNKYSPSGLTSTSMRKYANVQTWSNRRDFVVANQNGVSAFVSTIYPQATSINRDDSSSPILSYGNVLVRDFNNTTGVYTSYSSGKGLFETYYKSMFEMLKAKPRLRNVYIDLKVVDIINLDFTKLVYIDGVYWRINKIVDYQPNKNETTKVELVEWQQLGTFAATAPSFGGTTSNTNFGLGVNTHWDGGPADDVDPLDFEL